MKVITTVQFEAESTEMMAGFLFLSGQITVWVGLRCLTSVWLSSEIPLFWRARWPGISHQVCRDHLHWVLHPSEHTVCKYRPAHWAELMSIKTTTRVRHIATAKQHAALAWNLSVVASLDMRVSATSHSLSLGTSLLDSQDELRVWSFVETARKESLATAWWRLTVACACLNTSRFVDVFVLHCLPRVTDSRTRLSRLLPQIFELCLFASDTHHAHVCMPTSIHMCVLDLPMPQTCTAS